MSETVLTLWCNFPELDPLYPYSLQIIQRILQRKYLITLGLNEYSRDNAWILKYKISSLQTFSTELTTWNFPSDTSIPKRNLLKDCNQNLIFKVSRQLQMRLHNFGAVYCTYQLQLHHAQAHLPDVDDFTCYSKLRGLAQCGSHL